MSFVFFFFFFSGVNESSGTVAVIYQNQVNTTAADDLAPWVARSSATMVLTM